MSNLTSACGSRCAEMYALQVADSITADVPVPRMWRCFANVSHVDGIDKYPDSSNYDMPDQQAQIMAGALGWSGIISEASINSTSLDTPEEQLQMRSYPVDSQWSPPGNVTADEMARLVMKFTTGAIGALDTVGIRSNLTG